MHVTHAILTDSDQPPLLRNILGRSSVAPKTLLAPGPTQQELRLIVAAALTSPAHDGVRPFRFIHIASAARDQLANTYVAIKKQRDPRASAQELARVWKKTMRAPTLLAVVARISSGNVRVPAHEQYVTIGGAIYAVLLACHSLGFGAITLSGERSRHPLVRELLNIASEETVVCFISMGTPSKPITPKNRPDPESFLDVWDGNAAAIAD